MPKLIDGITVAKGYRPEFVRFMKANLVEPRQSPFDKIYEWARGNVATDRGMPGCRCMQAFLVRLDMPGEWLSMVMDLAKKDKVAMSVLIAEQKKYGSVPVKAASVYRVEEQYGVYFPHVRKVLKLDTKVEPPCPARVVSDQSASPPSPKDSAPKSLHERIKAVILALDPPEKNPEIWTNKGKPYVTAIEKKLGVDITAKARNVAWAEICRDRANKHAKPSPPAPKKSPKKAPDDAPKSMLTKIAKTARTVTYKEVIKAFQHSPIWRLQPQLLDRSYTALPVETWCEILAWSDVDRVKYVAEKRDCDNFAVALAGQVSLRLGVNGCGIVVDYSGKHAYNCILVTGDFDKDGKEDLKVLLVEPQSDTMPQIGDRIGRHEAYAGQRGVVLMA